MFGEDATEENGRGPARPDAEGERASVSRRDFAAVAGGIAAAATAGCLGLGGDSDAGGDGSAGGDDAGVSQAVEDRLAAMDREAKVWQVLQTDLTTITEGGVGSRGEIGGDLLDPLVGDLGLGSVLTGGGSAPVPNTPEGWAETTNRIQRIAGTGEGATPVVYGTDAVHGHNNLAAATIYPHNLGLGATWNPGLARQLREETATALRATGVHWNFDPVCDLARDHRWGRYYECFGEDPLLVSAMAAASVEGLQGGDGPPGAAGVAATAKHFVGYSRPRGGLDRNPAQISWRRLRSQHLPAFQAAVDAGAEAVMLNSGSVNGVPSHASATAVREVLREEMGFEGVVISDWDDAQRLRSMHGVGETLQDAVGLLLEAGVDLFMVGSRTDLLAEALHGLLEDGEIEEARLDASIRRILRLKERLGLFESATVDPDAAADAVGGNRELARRAAAQSLTLLEHGGTLPFEGDEDLLVTGPGADSAAMALGGWTVGWQGVSGDRQTPETTTVLEGAEAAMDGAVDHVSWDLDGAGDPAAVRNAAADADAVVAVLGEGPYAEGQGDDQRATLAEDQAELVRTAADTDTPVVGIVLAGRPIGIEAIRHHLDELLMAYLPGSAGGTAIADALVGDVVPSGRLPVTWPRHGGQAPVHYNALPGGGSDDPSYAFAAGESYASFQNDIPQLETATLEAPSLEETVELSVDVTNDGSVAADRVVVAFGEREYAPGPEQLPRQSVVGFDRVRLEPGEQRTVTVPCSIGALATVGGDVTGRGERTVAPGAYDLRVGDWTTTLTVE